ncbi:MAG: hypothetical protein ACEPOW_12670 [Bacteroidales bacterium]
MDEFNDELRNYKFKGSKTENSESKDKNLDGREVYGFHGLDKNMISLLENPDLNDCIKLNQKLINQTINKTIIDIKFFSIESKKKSLFPAAFNFDIDIEKYKK